MAHTSPCHGKFNEHDVSPNSTTMLVPNNSYFGPLLRYIYTTLWSKVHCPRLKSNSYPNHRLGHHIVAPSPPHCGGAGINIYAFLQYTSTPKFCTYLFQLFSPNIKIYMNT